MIDEIYGQQTLWNIILDVNGEGRLQQRWDIQSEEFKKSYLSGIIGPIISDIVRREYLNDMYWFAKENGCIPEHEEERVKRALAEEKLQKK